MIRGYRVWDDENKTYDDPYSYAYYAMKQDGELDFYCHGDHMGEADPDVYIIEPATGLTDKNGKEIYEGDILETCCGKAEVYFDDELFMYRLYLKHGNTMPLVSKKSNRDLEYEVIGNIHEDKETKGGKK